MCRFIVVIVSISLKRVKMKYLLKHRLNTVKKEWLIKVFPNEFSSQFIKLANKHKLIIEKEYEWTGKYKKIKSYLMFQKDFNI